LASEEQADLVETTEGLTLKRELGLLGLVAVSVCTVIGGGINVLSVEAQAKVPGIGWMVPLAFVLGVMPALFCALSYASLASAMPRAGGGYVYISRALHPFIGFMATTSKWFGLASVIGVLAFIDVPLLRDAATYWGWTTVAHALSGTFGSLILPLVMVWLFWGINMVGMRMFGATCVALMILMLTGGACLIFTGFTNSTQDFMAVVTQTSDGKPLAEIAASPMRVGGFGELIKATGFLFFAYIGFATISQAGGETRNPRKLLPKAFVISTLVIAGYYLLYSAALYHAVPWKYVAHEASLGGVTGPGLIGPLLNPWIAGFVAFTAAIALANDIPPMLMAVSRLFFSWAKDGIFPKGLASINKTFHTPHWALTACAVVASLVVLECHLHPEDGFFLGVDMVTIALLFTYMMVAVALLAFPKRNPELYKDVVFLKTRGAQVFVAVVALISIAALFATQVYQDAETVWEAIQAGTPALLAVPRSATFVWLMVMAAGAVLFGIMWGRSKARGEDPMETFRTLPSESLETELAPTSE